jgi:hypothetical protein
MLLCKGFDLYLVIVWTQSQCKLFSSQLLDKSATKTRSEMNFRQIEKNRAFGKCCDLIDSCLFLTFRTRHPRPSPEITLLDIVNLTSEVYVRFSFTYYYSQFRSWNDVAESVKNNISIGSLYVHYIFCIMYNGLSCLKILDLFTHGAKTKNMCSPYWPNAH